MDSGAWKNASSVFERSLSDTDEGTSSKFSLGYYVWFDDVWLPMFPWTIAYNLTVLILYWIIINFLVNTLYDLIILCTLLIRWY